MLSNVAGLLLRYRKKIIIVAIIILALIVFYVLGALSAGKDISYIPI